MMADPRALSPVPERGHRTTMRRPLQSTSQSPSRQRLGDALLSRLTPASAVEALRAPSGPLKACLDEASPSEQHFAIKTAVASKKIHDWLDELLDWPWPKENTYAGFEVPPAKRRKLFKPQEPNTNHSPGQEHPGGPEPEIEYLGSVPARDVARYEIRIEQVQKGMNELDLEEIKSHVLLNHIMPLSRPGTPYSDAGRSIASSIPFSKMEDITAVITAITVQALPNVSRLTRLLNTWTIRIIVLRKVSSVLTMITDAEIALKSGWNAIEDQKPIGDNSSDTSNMTILSQQDFEVMNSVLRKKVALPGKELDYMLDILEGMRDTLPDEWLERMDAVERDYAEWVVTAERRARTGEMGDTDSSLRLDTRQAPQTPQPKIQVQTPSPTQERQMSETETHGLTILIKGPSSDIPISADQVSDLGEIADHQEDADSRKAAKDVSVDVGLDEQEVLAATRKSRSGPLTGRTKARTVNGSPNRPQDTKANAALSELDQNVLHKAPALVLGPSPTLHSKKSMPDMETDSSFLESVYEDDEDDEDDDEPQLPPARFQYRRDSEISMASTVLHDPASILGHSDDLHFREGSMEPELPRLPDPDQPFSSDAPSPPSSPPLRCKVRTHSVSFNEIPEISELPEEDVTPPRSPLEPPEMFGPGGSYSYRAPMSSPGNASVISETGDELHQQIRQVLKGLPNNIQLSTRPSAINLNPPDFQHPSKPKARAPENSRRSGSALSTRSTMSSRASTPSWMLAPARTPRPQSSTEIKTYYLSRANGEAPLKLLIRCVGENGERVMVRVGGGWADLGEYLKEYAIHHSRRSKGESKVEVRDSSTLNSSVIGSSPPSRPGSALEAPMTPLAVRKTRKSTAGKGSSKQKAVPSSRDSESPPSDTSIGSRGSRAMSHPNSSILGMSGPHPKKARALSEESRQWIEDMRNKVRSVSGEQRAALEHSQNEGKFGELGKVGGTKRVFRKNLA